MDQAMTPTEAELRAMTTESELMPCPFCGGKPHMMLGGYEGNWVVECTNTSCQATHGTAYSNEAAAISAWNRRPTPGPIGLADETIRLAEALFDDLECDGHDGKSENCNICQSMSALQLAFRRHAWASREGLEITLHAGSAEEDGRQIASFIWPKESLGDLTIPTRWRLQAIAPSNAATDSGKWRTIDSAPKDGTAFLWWNSYKLNKPWSFAVISWPTYEECFDDGYWQPLPEPPTAALAARKG